ncbi:Zinc finger protein 271 [Collichthys lucidus]|uniref:Zinc finger protein 271 n=1 Tax=Collichthys lucidus TaxID=240159 RepID=A0A4U5UNX8_COLLU|nr:Zinc finger protein 271 [Collichthys lucidus]
MPSCCITSCRNRHYTSRKLKFYRIPCDYRPFQANRRRLWLRAIQRANGSAEPLRENARICGAHFISGEASLHHDNPDFVPSVFTGTPQSPKKKGKWVYGRRKSRRRAACTEEETAPPTVDSPVDLQSSALLEETLSSPSEQESKASMKEVEAETKAVKEQRTFKVPTGIPKLDHMIPVVLLKSVFVPGHGYRCELCNEHFPIASQLVKHKQLHEDEEEERSFFCAICGKLFTSEADFTAHQRIHEHSFPCNMCDRSFTTSQQLKRHKLMHVKDGRKCKKCGVLFCQRHRHILFRPQPQTQESSSESEEDSSADEPPHSGSSLLPENNQLLKPVPKQTADLHDDVQSTIAVTTSRKTTVQTSSCTPPNLKPVPKTPNVGNNQLVKPAPNQTVDLHDNVQGTRTVTPLQETTAQHVQDDCEESCSASEPVSSIAKPQHLGRRLFLLVNKPETNQTADLCDGAEKTITFQETSAPSASCAPLDLKPPPKTYLPPASRTETSSEIPLTDMIRSFVGARPRRPPKPPKPSTLIRLQHPELPPSLKLFSPQYLTSAFIEVKRNYDYILSKPRGVRSKEDIVQEENCVVREESCVVQEESCVVKEEPCELPLSPPKELNIVNVRHVKKEPDVPVRPVKKEKIAYDIEFVF